MIGQKLASLTYSFLHTSEYVQVTDLEADSVRGPNDIWKLQLPGNSVVLGIGGKPAWIGGKKRKVLNILGKVNCSI